MGRNGSSRNSKKQKQFLEYRKGNRKVALLGVAGLFLLGVSVYVALRGSSGPEAVPPPAAEALPTGQDVRLAASLFADGRAHFYRYTTSTGRDIRLFVVRSSDGVIRAAFDACDVCYRERKGYYQSGDTMICANCGRAFHSKDINVITGGCNPTPLRRSIDGHDVLLKAADLELGAAYF